MPPLVLCLYVLNLLKNVIYRSSKLNVLILELFKNNKENRLICPKT